MRDKAVKLKTTNNSCNKRGPRTTRTALEIKQFGGLHAQTIGTSTKDQTDLDRDQQAAAEFNRELQKAIDGVDWTQPF